MPIFQFCKRIKRSPAKVLSLFSSPLFMKRFSRLHFLCRVSLLWVIGLLASLELHAQNKENSSFSDKATSFIENSSLQTAYDILQKSEENEEAIYSIAIQNVLDPSDAYYFQAQRSLCPASVTKLFTTAIALEVLGPDYSFVTDLFIRGEVRQQTLEGDLIVVGNGDPSLASKYFPQDSTRWFESVYATLKAHHIKEIKGNIIIEASAFEVSGVNPKWAEEDMGEYYGAGVYAANIYDNWVNLFYQTGKNQSDFSFMGTYPPDTEVEWIHNLTVNRKQSGWGCRGYGLEERRTLKGSLPCNRERITLKSDLPNPPRYMGLSLKRKLSELGIIVEGAVQTSFSPLKNRGKLVGKYYSPSLKELCRVMNFRSLNHYAEAILKAIALDPSQASPASTKQAVARAMQIWNDKTIAFSPTFQLHDGSGLAKANRTSANDVVTLLNHVALGPTEEVDAFMQSLPLAGVEGSVKSFMTNSHLRMFVKSGSMRGIQCYAGYLHYKGHSYSVALLASDVNNRGKVRTVLQRYLETLFPPISF